MLLINFYHSLEKEVSISNFTDNDKCPYVPVLLATISQFPTILSIFDNLVIRSGGKNYDFNISRQAF